MNLNKMIISDYQIVLYILHTSIDKSVGHVLQRLSRLKEMIYD